MSGGFRPEIQALRALAVALVVLFHLWPDRLTGGYVGVDVFFVISGYLITAHLVREIHSTGRVQLTKFYTRRMRRLLPAAFLVLLVAVAGVLLFVPRGEWPVMLRDIWTAAVYSVNWVLAVSSVDYFAAEEAASPVQHYWSLSVEEQFYIVWPLLLMLAWRIRKKRGLLVGLGIVFALSLSYSVVGAYRFQEFAYFATPAHAWEFAIGAFVALVLPAAGLRDGWWLTAASWAGWATIAASAVLLDASSLFPGWIALIPVLGTVLVIASGVPRGAWSPSDVVQWRPVQFLGDISYSLYLWHWLPIVLLPYVLSDWVGRSYLTGTEKFVILAACIALAWLTKVLVEDPLRSLTLLRAPSRTFVAGIATTALVVSCAIAPILVVEHERAAEAARIDAALQDALGDTDQCFGAAAAFNTSACPSNHQLADPASVEFLAEDTEFEWVERRAAGDDYFAATCSDSPAGNEMCRYGDASADVAVAVVGDSHVGHLLPAILTAAAAHDWAVEVWRFAECTPAVELFQLDEPDARPECQDWRSGIFKDVANSEADIVVTSSYTARYSRWYTKSPSSVNAIAEGFIAGWNSWTEAGKQVLAVSDVPSWRSNVPRCLTQAPSANDPCSELRDLVLFSDPLLIAAEREDHTSVASLDLRPSVCDGERCHAVVGGIAVARDISHLTATFATTLAPQFDVAMQDLLKP